MTLPDELKMRRARKIVDSGMSTPLAHLDVAMETNDRLEELTQAIKDIPQVEIPETVIPEYPTSIEINNLPEIQKVELVNPPKEKDDKEQLKLLKQIADEIKKKEEYAYDIEIDSVLKEQLRGYTPVKGVDYFDGKDGTEITPSEIVEKLESLDGDERLDVSSVRGTEALIEDIAKKIAKEEVKKVKPQRVTMYSGGSSSSSSSGGLGDSFETVSNNLSAYSNTLNYNGNGDITSIVYSNGVTKTFNYTGSDITSIVLSGSTPSGINLTKTLTYTDGDVTGITYS